MSKTLSRFPLMITRLSHGGIADIATSLGLAVYRILALMPNGISSSILPNRVVNLDPNVKILNRLECCLAAFGDELVRVILN